MRKPFFILYILAIAMPMSTFCQEDWTAEELRSANTASYVSILTKEEKDVIMYMNLARMYPQKFARVEVEPYDGGPLYGFYLKGSPYKASLLEELKTRKPVSPLYFDKAMYNYAKCWAIESGQLGVTGHNRITCSKGYSAECCFYGARDNGREAVLSLLIDHDVPSLGHRKNILNGDLKKAGPNIQPHIKYGYCCVIDYTSGESESTSSNYYSNTTPSKNTTTPSRQYSNQTNKQNYSAKQLFYSRHSVNYFSLIKIGVTNTKIHAGTLGIRSRMFCLNLFDFETPLKTHDTLYYRPNIKVSIPCSKNISIGFYSGASINFETIINYIDEDESEYNYGYGAIQDNNYSVNDCHFVGLTLGIGNTLTLFSEFRFGNNICMMQTGLEISLGYGWW